MSGKTHTTAVVLIPPEATWGPIQEIRRAYDRQVRRWMPHVTLLYPFRPVAELHDAVRLLAECVRGLEPFELTLAELHTFRHGRSGHTVWLQPEPRGAVRGLHARLLAAFPDCDDTARFTEGFSPHLSVGQFRGPRDALTRFVAQLGSAWRPLVFRVEAIHVIAREDTPDDVFRVFRDVRLCPTHP
jgi:2'-5' RNA ligase